MLKVVSGGQTGVDRVALDVAIELQLEHGGWCPLGRRAEDGIIPAIYELKETNSRNYKIRTEQNIIDSDGTLVLFCGTASGGTSLTIRLAEKHVRPLLSIDVDEDSNGIADKILAWIESEDITVLNVAGPRLSNSPELPDRIKPILKAVFESCKSVG